MNDFELKLRKALDKATANAPQAERDLVKVASQAAQAVSAVTEGLATLELVSIREDGDPRPTYQLRLRRIDSEAPASDLGVFRVSEGGYPIDRWATLRNWEANLDKPERQHFNVGDLKGNFDYMFSQQDSKLVVLLNSLPKKKA